MKILERKLREGSPATLSIYLHEVSAEMPDRAVRPVMLVIPGGGYCFCSDREGEPIALDWFNRGFQVAVLRYTVISGENPAPLYLKPLTDAAAAMALLRQNSADWQMNPHKIAVIGFSAGGHLAASLAAHWDDPCLGAQNARPDAVILGYPVITGSPQAGFGGEYVNDKLTADEPEWVDYFALEKQTRPDMPPAFVWTTYEDATVNMLHSLLYVQAMHRVQVPCELHLYDHGGHGYALANGETNANGALPPDAGLASWRALAEQWLCRLFGWIC